MQQLQKTLMSNGDLPITLGWSGAYHKFKITGGPFDAYRRSANSFGLCVRAEDVPMSADLNLPIKDFGVPGKKADVDYALRRALQSALDGKDVYVGCMGGWGRTGLFLALIAKVCGEADPVAYVRKHYTPRAVETTKQAVYVAEFDVTELREWLAVAAWSARILPGFGSMQWGSKWFWWLN